MKRTFGMALLVAGVALVLAGVKAAGATPEAFEAPATSARALWPLIGGAAGVLSGPGITLAPGSPRL